MWRKIILTVMAAMIAMLGFAGPAVAEPTAVPAPGPGGPATTKSAKELPAGFPSDLKKFVAGTDEFKSAPWFTGACKDKGGDMGQYSTEVMHNENRLLYWTAKDQDRIAQWASKVMLKTQNPFLLDALTAAGGIGSPMSGVDMSMPANQKAALSISDESVLKMVYMDTFPLNEAADMYPPSPTCANDLARWTTKTSSTWGFDWADTPDPASLAVMKKQPNAENVPAAAWTAACGAGVPSTLCMHAMFVNCEKAEAGKDQMTCTEWNARIGKLFGGTMNWIEQNATFSDRLGRALESTFKSTPAYQSGKMFVDGFTWVWDNTIEPLADLVAFVKDPSDVIDSWANKLKSSAISTTNSVLHGLAGIGEFDPAKPEFVAVYAMSTGLGLLVMVVMTMLAIHKSSDGSLTGEELAKSLFAYMPAGIMMMMFAPSAAQLLISLMHELSLALVSAIGTTTDQVINNISTVLGSLTSETMVGGSIAAIIGFGLMFLGAMAMFFGFLMHAAALPILATVCGIAFGMWVHPTWRKKALRPVMMFLGVLFSKPLMFVLLAVIFAVINIAAKSSVADDGKLESLGQLSLIAVCFVIIGLAPFTLLKYSPILPTSADSADFGGGGSSAGQTLGTSSQMFQRQAGGGSGGAGEHNAGAAGSPGSGAGKSGFGGGNGSSGGGKSASSTHAASTGGPTSSPSIGGGKGGGSHGGGVKAGGAESKLMGAAGAAAGAATIVAPIALSAAGAAMNKAGSAAQSAPEHADGDN